MIKVNLEKQLIRQNKKVLMPDELLKVKEYDRVGDNFVNDTILQRLGLTDVAHEGRLVRYKEANVKTKLKSYDKDRIFHISQIKSLCEKYHLRFLNVRYYKGSVDPELSKKISQFEIATNKQVESYNSYIVAPANSFKLEEKPKDPLFFFDLGDGYFYLIHKWGNDLNAFRRLIAYTTNRWVNGIIFQLLVATALYFKVDLSAAILWMIGSSIPVHLFINGLLVDVNNYKGFTIFRKNVWDSHVI